MHGNIVLLLTAFSSFLPKRHRATWADREYGGNGSNEPGRTYIFERAERVYTGALKYGYRLGAVVS